MVEQQNKVNTESNGAAQGEPYYGENAVDPKDPTGAKYDEGRKQMPAENQSREDADLKTGTNAGPGDDTSRTQPDGINTGSPKTSTSEDYKRPESANQSMVAEGNLNRNRQMGNVVGSDNEMVDMSNAEKTGTGPTAPSGTETENAQGTDQQNSGNESSDDVKRDPDGNVEGSAGALKGHRGVYENTNVNNPGRDERGNLMEGKAETLPDNQ